MISEGFCSYMYQSLVSSASKLLQFDFEDKCQIEIHVGEFDTSKCNGIDAGCFQKPDGSFVILIDSENHSIESLVVHELIHVWQICTKRLQIKRKVWHWLGQPYEVCSPQHLKHSDYLNLPWEREARTLTDMVCQQLLNLQK